ncbi:unnamed protein product [Choristocarpus tenellus]
MSTTIEMRPLSQEDCLTLAQAVIGKRVLASHPDVDVLPGGSGQILYEKSGDGNPPFVRNIAMSLRDGLLNNGTVMKLENIPAGFFHNLIISRFDALEPIEQTVLKAATGKS